MSSSLSDIQEKILILNYCPSKNTENSLQIEREIFYHEKICWASQVRLISEVQLPKSIISPSEGPDTSDYFTELEKTLFFIGLKIFGQLTSP